MKTKFFSIVTLMALSAFCFSTLSASLVDHSLTFGKCGLKNKPSKEKSKKVEAPRKQERKAEPRKTERKAEPRKAEPRKAGRLEHIEKSRQH